MKLHQNMIKRKKVWEKELPKLKIINRKQTWEINYKFLKVTSSNRKLIFLKKTMK